MLFQKYQTLAGSRGATKHNAEQKHLQLQQDIPEEKILQKIYEVGINVPMNRQSMIIYSVACFN